MSLVVLSARENILAKAFKQSMHCSAYEKGRISKDELLVKIEEIHSDISYLYTLIKEESIRERPIADSVKSSDGRDSRISNGR